MGAVTTAAVLDALADAWALLMPVDCAGCGTPDRGLCRSCRARLAPQLTWHSLADGTPAVTALDYAGVPRQVILAFKEQGRTDVARALAAPLASALEAAAATTRYGAPELVPVPTSRRSYRRRGYDPVALLLRKGGYAHRPVLRHSRRTSHQKALDAEARRRNLSGSLRAAHPLDGRTFIVVDDVLTTGATLGEAVRAIREAGGSVVATAALAHTAQLFPSS